MAVKKVSVKVAEKTTLEKFISYGPLLPCVAVAVLVTSGLSGYQAPAAALGSSAPTSAVSASADTANAVPATTTAALVRTATQSRTNPPRTTVVAADGAKRSLGSVTEAAGYKDGTYTGTATGFAGPLTVAVTVSGGKVVEIRVTNTSDNEPYLSNAKAVIDRIIAGQTTNVDAVSGATYSSNGIIGAVREALSKAAVSSSAKAALGDRSESGSGSDAGASDGTRGAATTSTTRAPVSDGKAGQFPYPDGTYEGEGEGRNDIIRLSVTLKDGTITDIQVLEHSEDEVPYFNNAKQLLEDVKTSQSLTVDTVSGATLSSKGLLEALNDAVAKAKTAGSPTTTTTVAVVSDEERTSPQSESSTDATSSAQPANPVTQKKAESPATDPEEGTRYKNGEYFVTVTCRPDSDEDFEAYDLSVKVTIKGDRIVGVSNISGDGGSSNDSYISKAANGTSKKTGVVSQITAKGDTSGVDAVSGATCTSDAILEACEQALAQAAAANG